LGQRSFLSTNRGLVAPEILRQLLLAKSRHGVANFGLFDDIRLLFRRMVARKAIKHPITRF
jgi:hypothetical protein